MVLREHVGSAKMVVHTRRRGWIGQGHCFGWLWWYCSLSLLCAKGVVVWCSVMGVGVGDIQVVISASERSRCDDEGEGEDKGAVDCVVASKGQSLVGGVVWCGVDGGKNEGG